MKQQDTFCLNVLVSYIIEKNYCHKKLIHVTPSMCHLRLAANFIGLQFGSLQTNITCWAEVWPLAVHSQEGEHGPRLQLGLLGLLGEEGEHGLQPRCSFGKNNF